MQLTMEVLPAPFGPMMEKTSPRLTSNETSVSARTPPKRRLTCAAARMGVPVSATAAHPGSGLARCHVTSLPGGLLAPAAKLTYVCFPIDRKQHPPPLTGGENEMARITGSNGER